MDWSQLSSVTGIMGVVTVVIGLLKPYLGKAPVLAKLPVVVYAVPLALLLVLVANKTGLLPGNVKSLVVQAFWASLVATGFQVSGVTQLLQSMESAFADSIVVGTTSVVDKPAIAQGTTSVRVVAAGTSTMTPKT